MFLAGMFRRFPTRPCAFHALALLLAIALGACSFSSRPTITRLESAGRSTQVTFYTLDPADRAATPMHGDGWFYGFHILGRAAITNEREKRALLDAFARGLADAPASASLCFNPRHGLTLHDAEGETDYVICFECRAVRRYAPVGHLRIGAGPRPTFNAIAAAHGLPVASGGQ